MRETAVVVGPVGSAAVAAGSAEAVLAAVELLAAGGSAVDAALAGAFASPIAEPALSSLGGGGFLLHAEQGHPPEVLDFFVAVPGLEGEVAQPHVRTVVVDFAKAGPAAAASEQVFHVGWGTVAVPGCLPGYLDAHRRWGRLPLADVLAPANRFSAEGVALSPVQRHILGLVAEPLSLTEESRAVFGEAISAGFYRNPDYAALLDALADRRVSAATDAEYGGRLLRASRSSGGLLTPNDLMSFVPTLREPSTTQRGGVGVWTNPPPSAGGAIVLEALDALPARPGPVDWRGLAAAQADATMRHRGPGQVPTGTTHISVIAADGSTAALTTSNGSGSGTVVPGWGVALNNMLGEEDLVPGDSLTPGQRMGSMMAPTLLVWPDGSRVVLGTGGSERIRSATACVLARMIDEGQDLETAVRAPRLHVNAEHQVHVEPSFDPGDWAGLDELARQRGWPSVEYWPTNNLFFGGVHAVRRAADGSVIAVGDGRRGGAAAVLHPDGHIESLASEGAS